MTGRSTRIGLIVALVILVGGGGVLARQAGNRAILRGLEASRHDLAQHGWSVSWRIVRPRWALFVATVEFVDFRLSATVGDFRVFYGADVLAVRRPHFFSHDVMMFPGKRQALVVNRREETVLALRLVSERTHLVAQLSSEGVVRNLVLTMPQVTMDLAALPALVPTGSLPATLVAESVRVRLHNRPQDRGGLAVDIGLEALRLPFSWPGLGDTLHGVEAAFSLPVTTGRETFLLHLAQGKLGAASAALSGRMTGWPVPTGDFDLVLRGVDVATQNMAASGAVSPEVGEAAAVLGRIARHDASPVTNGGDTKAKSGKEPLVDLPLRLREGRWWVGTLPLSAVLGLIARSRQP
ncbi:DUF2125 domain-containing protein [Acetobacter estunensis]|uniref:DUF2125 domain-containing protein n=1 Tax=Acetobacter estunensis TaxID=104097 RepID=UPI001C2D6BB9|nr:DUF2125 domain-containing protein [Acetobacter estunensis]